MNNVFSISLYIELSQREGNFLVSPFSIRTALAMTYGGARGNTAKEMAEVLIFPADQEQTHSTIKSAYDVIFSNNQDKFKLHIANALWGQKGYHFDKNFLELNQLYYGASLKELDFGNEPKARNTINNWVDLETNHKIKDLIPDGILSAASRLVLTNAIYFKANWAAPFEAEDTRPGDFETIDGEKVRVPMMFNESEFGYADLKEYQLLEMPYDGMSTSMVVLLPKKGIPLENIEKKLEWDSLNSQISQLKRQELWVYLPKFKVTSDLSLASVLEKMGIKDAFVYKKADFSGISGDRELSISAILHKTFVEVDEMGTEAAAATAVAMIEGGAMPSEDPPTFRADRPFLFFIRSISDGSILFIGRVSNPK